MAQIVVLGNAVVDGFCQVSEGILKKSHIPKGDYTHFSHAQFMALNEQVRIDHFAAGGSAANVAWTLGMLGHQTFFLGKVGEDAAGKHFYDDMQTAHVHMNKPDDTSRTFQIFVLITPDGARTFIEPQTTAMMTPDWIDKNAIATADWLLIEGYTLLDQWDAVQLAVSIARQNNTKIILSLAPPKILQLADVHFKTLIASGVDLIVSDTPEADVCKDILPDDILNIFENTNRIQTAGPDGATYFTPKTPAVFVATTPIKKPVNVTGAGDNFAAGFLHEMFSGAEVETALTYGHTLASHAINQTGARLPAAFFAE